MQQLAVAEKKPHHPSFGLGQKKDGGAAKKILSIFGLQNSQKRMGHLTLMQRYQIQTCIENGMTKCEIAEYLYKDRSVIYREIKRNSDARNNVYKAVLANKKAQARHKEKSKNIKFTLSIQNYVEKLLKEDFSPEQVVGISKRNRIECVSIERIYQHIWQDKRTGGKLYTHLRTKGKRYRKRGSNKDSRGLLKHRIDIDQRPAIVDKKERIGDLEIDLILGKDHKGALLTINDRASGILYMDKVKSKQASEIEAKTIKLLQDWKPLIHTITSDNGKEFGNHKNISEKLEIDFYFAHPYCSWERGANENINGLIRQYFPKGMDLRNIQKQEIVKVQNILNNRPRKRFGYKSPNEVFSQLLDNSSFVAFIT